VRAEPRVERPGSQARVTASSLELRVLRELDVRMRHLCGIARILPALTADNAAEERLRLVAAVSRGETPVPRWTLERRRVDLGVFRLLDGARALAEHVPAGELYRARLDEVELDLAILDALGDARRVRMLAARRFGTGALRVTTEAGGQASIARLARAMLDTVEASPEPYVLPAEARDGPSVAALLRAAAHAAHLGVEVRIEPRLAASAAAGDRAIFLAPRRFGVREATRIAAHEVLGHLVAGANGRAQPIRLFELGTAGSFADQEGMALCLEEAAGVLDGSRLRTLAARVIATDRLHAGASFGDTALELVREEGFSAHDATAIAERAHRGGGVARDVGYLYGWLRVRAAIANGTTTIDELRSGRIGLADVEPMRALASVGLVRAPAYRPSLERSLSWTAGGTRPDTSPPKLAASLTRLDAT